MLSPIISSSANVRDVGEGDGERLSTWRDAEPISAACAAEEAP